MAKLCRPRAGGKDMWLTPLCFSDFLVTQCMTISLIAFTDTAQKRGRRLGGVLWTCLYDFGERGMNFHWGDARYIILRTLQAGDQSIQGVEACNNARDKIPRRADK